MLTKEMQGTKERFFVFLEKLEEKLRNFAEEAIPELVELNNIKVDDHMEYYRVRAAVLGQLETILKKARDVKEEKVACFSYPRGDQKISDAYYQFRSECYDRHRQLEDLYSYYRTRIEDSFWEDYEAAYQKILDEHELIRNKFSCVQCGSPIAIDKIYFTTTYITCPACQSRNTFEPSTQAKSLEHLGRSLAEQRTAHLLQDFNEIPGALHELYLERHRLEISLFHERDKNIMEQKTKQIQDLEQQQKKLNAQMPVLYRNYLRAMFDEWNKINPDLKNEHERFYNSLLNESNKTIENR